LHHRTRIHILCLVKAAFAAEALLALAA